MDHEQIALLITAAAGLITALIGIWNQRDSAKKTELDAVKFLVTGLQGDNQALRLENSERAVEIKELETLVDTLQVDNRELSESLQREIGTRRALETRVTELVKENEKLHQYIGELRESVRLRGAFTPEVREIMRKIPPMIIKLSGQADACDACPPEMLAIISNLRKYSDAVVMMLNAGNGV